MVSPVEAMSQHEGWQDGCRVGCCDGLCVGLTEEVLKGTPGVGARAHPTVALEEFPMGHKLARLTAARCK